jgi:hypothetical protein
MYSKGAICLSRLLFKMGLFTVYFNTQRHPSFNMLNHYTEASTPDLKTKTFNYTAKLPRLSGVFRKPLMAPLTRQKRRRVA